MKGEMGQRLQVFAACLWWGSLTTIGFWVVPMLFANLPTPAMAGTMAARLFSAQTWVGGACGLILLLNYKEKQPSAPVNSASTAIIFIVLGLLMVMLLEFAVAPRILAREDLRVWHAVGTAMYLLQWLCAGVILWKVTKPTQDAPV
ncbi:MAG: hypothetical protein RL211_2229 [Pseudomonadota bacterium]|jgi:hypothetical protein